jgi:transposase
LTKKTRRRFTPEYKEQAVARLSEPGVTYASLSAELGITSGQLKGWHLELLAAGSATAIAETKAEAAELAQLRRDNKRLKESEEVQERPRWGVSPTNEVMRKASIFFAQWAAKT